MKNKSRSKFRLDSKSKATNVSAPAPEAAIWLSSSSVGQLADDIAAVLENRADDAQRRSVESFVIGIRNAAALEAMRNVPHQGWTFN